MIDSDFVSLACLYYCLFRKELKKILCGCHIAGGGQGQVRWGPGQPGLVYGHPANGQGLELGGL